MASPVGFPNLRDCNRFPLAHLAQMAVRIGLHKMQKGRKIILPKEKAARESGLRLQPPCNQFAIAASTRDANRSSRALIQVE